LLGDGLTFIGILGGIALPQLQDGGVTQFYGRFSRQGKENVALGMDPLRQLRDQVILGLQGLVG
jgi:hypothetical protein|tara:strand:- start:8922 stop:9113 length:192 start_codon:yes stop_codon:yes gene_type:complete